ncbi:MAG: hypothetical protein LBU88_05805 [Treponema sp.]|nr:hypothetical protein [Treponema sp.]
MKNKIKICVFIAVSALLLFFITACPLDEDHTIYWPDTLVYGSTSVNTTMGEWSTSNDTSGNMLRFINNRSSRFAEVWVKADGDDVGDTEDYDLVSVNDSSFTVKKGSNQYTVTYVIENNKLKIITSGGLKDKHGSAINNDAIYNKID